MPSIEDFWDSTLQQGVEGFTIDAETHNNINEPVPHKDEHD